MLRQATATPSHMLTQLGTYVHMIPSRAYHNPFQFEKKTPLCFNFNFNFQDASQA